MMAASGDSNRRAERLEAIDVRRAASESGELPRGLRRFYAVLLGGMLALVAAAIVAELAISLTSTRSPLGELSFEWHDDGRAGGYWHVEGDGVPDGSWALEGDSILALNGVDAAEIRVSRAARRELDRALRAGEPIEATVGRRPNARWRAVSGWSVFTFSSWRTRGVGLEQMVVDSALDGTDLVGALRALPPGVPFPAGFELEAAERELTARRPDLAELPAGTEVGAAVFDGDVIVAVSPPSSQGVQVDLRSGSWSSFPIGRFTETVVGRPRNRTESVARLGLHAAFLLIVVVGTLAVRARTASSGARWFVALCAVAGLPSLPMAIDSLRHWAGPLSVQLVEDVPIAIVGEDRPLYWDYPDGSEPFVGLALMIGVPLLLYAALRLLQEFPTRDEELAKRYGVPGFVFALFVIPMSLAVADPVRMMFGLGRPEEGAILTAVAFTSVVAAIVWPLIQIVRIAIARLRRQGAGQEALQARIALIGVTAGPVLLLVAVLVPSWYSRDIPWTIRADEVIRIGRSALLFVGVVTPFLAFFLAIVKQGLWEVDLLIKRATIYSVLTVLFFGAWIGLEVALEAFLEGRLVGVPMGDFLPAVLAGGLVAVSQRSIKSIVAGRSSRAGAHFGDRLETLADELGSLRPGALPSTLVRRVVELLEPAYCALLVRDGGGLAWRAWGSNGTATGSVAVAAALSGLLEQRHQIVLFDDGPTLVTRIGAADDPAGVLVMGALPDEVFYSAEQRRTLSFFVGTLAPRLAAARD